MTFRLCDFIVKILSMFPTSLMSDLRNTTQLSSACGLGFASGRPCKLG